MANKYWFRKRKGLRSKDMGYGFVPISWEGLISIGVLLGGILLIMYDLGLLKEDAPEAGINFLVFVIIWIALFYFFAKSRSKD